MAERGKVLVVDDEKEFCKNLKDILEIENNEVTIAYDGFKAIELVKKNDFDLVIMDVKMPVMNGVETFKKMKKIAPDTPVIMVTAYAVEELLREALRNGAFGIMKKPLDFDKLFRLIDQAIPDGALILAVDDDKDFCTNIKDNLEEKGFRVSVAYDGNAAIKKAHEENFDVILLDMKLPPINGLETYLLIRDIRPNVIVIIITGYPKEMGDLAREAIEKNAYICLEKPIDMDNLISIIKQIKVHKAAGIRKKPE